MIMMGGFALPSKPSSDMIVSSVDVIVQAARLRDGSRRKITHITEVIGMEGDVVTTAECRDLRHHGRGCERQADRRHRSTGIARPRFWERAEYYGNGSPIANAIDVIVRGVKSGLPLNECIQVIARESPEPLASEFQEVVDQQRMGVPLSECLDRLCTRMPLQEIRFLAIVIAIQQQAGGNLSEALANLSGVLRDRFMLAMKVKALSAEAKASAIVLASLPPGVMGMVTLASPEYIQPLYTTTVGHFMMIGSGLWMLTGVLMMRKMINFKF
jgi:hypothetical protein